MAKELDRQELVALEYLVSSACNFLVELHQNGPQDFHFEPACGDAARRVGQYDQGQYFWSMYGPKRFDDPFQAAIMFVNAYRVWESKMKEADQITPNRLH